MIDEATTSHATLDAPRRGNDRRLFFGCVASGCGCFTVLAFLIIAIVAYSILDNKARQRRPEVQQEAEILAAGGRAQRESLAPRLSAILDGNWMPHGPIWGVTYWDAKDRSPLTVAKMEPLTELS